MAGDGQGQVATRRLPMVGLLAPLLTVGAVTVAALPAGEGLAAGTVPMLFLAAVVMAALAGGVVSALLGTGLAVAAYDFYFLQPRLSFSVAEPGGVVTLTVFVGLALATGTMAARVKEQAARRDAAAQSAAALLHVARRLAMTNGPDAVLSFVVQQLARLLGSEAVFVRVSGHELTVAASSPKRQRLTAREAEAARQALTDGDSDGAGFHFRAVVVGTRVIGVLGIKRQAQLTSEENGILTGVLDQASVALDRLERAQARGATEARTAMADELRDAVAMISAASSRLSATEEGGAVQSRADLRRAVAEVEAVLERSTTALPENSPDADEDGADD